MNNEESHRKHIMIKQNECSLTGKIAANAPMEHYAQANCINVQLDRKESLDEEQIALDNVHSALEEHVMASLNHTRIRNDTYVSQEKEITRKMLDNKRNANRIGRNCSRNYLTS